MYIKLSPKKMWFHIWFNVDINTKVYLKITSIHGKLRFSSVSCYERSPCNAYQYTVCKNRIEKLPLRLEDFRPFICNGPSSLRSRAFIVEEPGLLIFFLPLYIYSNLGSTRVKNCLRPIRVMYRYSIPHLPDCLNIYQLMSHLPLNNANILL